MPPVSGKWTAGDWAKLISALLVQTLVAVIFLVSQLSAMDTETQNLRDDVTRLNSERLELKHDLHEDILRVEHAIENLTKEIRGLK